MNDQWKQYVEWWRSYFTICAEPGCDQLRLLKLVDAQDAVVKAAEALRWWNPRLDEKTREELAAEYDAALRALAELKLE